MPERRLEDANPPLAPSRRGRRVNLELLLKDFARFIDSDVALLCGSGGSGQPLTVTCSWGLGGPPRHIARPLAGGLVGRALGHPAQGAALGPLDPVLDSSLIQARQPPLSYAVATTVPSASGDGGVLFAEKTRVAGPIPGRASSSTPRTSDPPPIARFATIDAGIESLTVRRAQRDG